jgi:hypothetical protein
MSHKVDVAIQSYKKPESLIYSLLSLHRQSKDSVDTVWINDDKSGGDILDIYNSLALKNALHPWKIKVRENKVRMGWWLSFVKGYKPNYLSYSFMLIRMLWNYYQSRHIFVERQDIRYQWAIDNTDKKYLFVMHDDMLIKKDVVGVYYKAISDLDNPAIVGELGQCWRCVFNKLGCTPEKIISGYRPGDFWPMTKLSSSDHAWACRVNEWSAMLSVSAAKEIEQKDRLFFGNFDNKGDTSAYWFATAVSSGYDFTDPINPSERNDFYVHGDEGKSGHSVWVDQGNGKSQYKAAAIRERLLNDFAFKWTWS